MTYEVILHYGDSGFEENISGEIYHSFREASYIARKNNEFMGCDDYENGDYYFVKEVK